MALSFNRHRVPRNRHPNYNPETNKYKFTDVNFTLKIDCFDVFPGDEEQALVELDRLIQALDWPVCARYINVELNHTYTFEEDKAECFEDLQDLESIDE